MFRIILLLILTLFTQNFVNAGYTLHKGKLVNTDLVPVYSMEGHFALASKAYANCKWREAAKNFNIVAYNFPNSSLGKESQFYLGVSYFYDDEYEDANAAFNAYLNCDNSPRFFETAIEYKLEIARQFHLGAKRRCFGTRMLPKWLPATNLAIDVYNEVIAALPCHPLAAYALYLKGCLHAEEYSFKESVESFQTLIRRFPKDELTPEAYLSINRVYLVQASLEFQNPDILALAELNARRFANDFPKEERLEEAENDVQAIKEIYAKGLYDTAQFYERKNKETAAIIYYRTAVLQFPDTYYAVRSQRRLNWLMIGKEDQVCTKECETSEENCEITF